MVAVILVLPTLFRIPHTKSGKYKVFMDFYKQNYSSFIKYMSMVFVVPIICFVVIIYLLGAIGAITPQDVGMPLQNVAILPALLVSAHLLKASAVVGHTTKKRIGYTIVTLIYLYFLWNQFPNINIVRLVYYSALAFVL